MSDLVVDSSVVAKWMLPEADSDKAQDLIAQSGLAGSRLIVLDLVFPEVANAIWKRYRQKRIKLEEVKDFLTILMASPVHIEPAGSLLPQAMEIAVEYDRAIYDALFVALSHKLSLSGITADEPLYNAVHKDFPEITLLCDR